MGDELEVKLVSPKIDWNYLISIKLSSLKTLFGATLKLSCVYKKFSSRQPCGDLGTHYRDSCPLAASGVPLECPDTQLAMRALLSSAI